VIPYVKDSWNRVLLTIAVVMPFGLTNLTDSFFYHRSFSYFHLLTSGMIAALATQRGQFAVANSAPNAPKPAPSGVTSTQRN